MADNHAADIAELSAWIDGLVKEQAKPVNKEPPEVADALVIIATSVVCESCQQHHISSSRVMRRIPRGNGVVVYKAVDGPIPTDLPRIVEWAFETNQECWKCFDLAERLVDPTVQLALAPEKVEVENNEKEKVENKVNS